MGRLASLSLSLLALVHGVTPADGAPPFVKATLETGKVGGGSPAVVKDVLAGEVPGIRASLVSLGSGGRHVEGRSDAEDKVYLVLEGRGAVVADGAPLPVGRQTIVRLPVGTDVDGLLPRPRGPALAGDAQAERAGEAALSRRR